jgi:hypothetical protein
MSIPLSRYSGITTGSPYISSNSTTVILAFTAVGTGSYTA